MTDLKDLCLTLRQSFCKHTFRGIDMVPRDASGIVAWPCHKCGKVYRETYGLLIGSHGTISGPWRTVRATDANGRLDN